ncbi:MAG: MATE family efflux transporter [Clostridiales bacterium]|nr:MATE family efflux transporter [Clostridiales bacterium]
MKEKTVGTVNEKKAVTLNKMGTMPIGKLIFTMALPPIFSMLIQAVYNIVDGIVVSGIEEAALTAVTLVAPVQFLLVALGAGTGVGINSLIARRLGEKRQDEANTVATTAFILAFVNYIVFLVFGLFFTELFVNAFAKGDMQVAAYAVPYCRITCVGSIFANYLFIVEKVVQATGNMVQPMICSLLSAAVKIILNPCLVKGLGFFPELGIRGAAIATCVGQACGIALLLYFFFAKKQQVHIRIKGFRFRKDIVKNIYIVGGPAIIMQSISSFMQMGLNTILMPLSSTAVAVLGAYFRLQNFVFMPMFGLNQGLVPICGYNFGARNKARLMEAYKKGLLTAFVIGVVGFVAFQFFSQPLMTLFDPSDDMMAMGIHALKIISFCFIPAAFGICTSNLFQATGNGFYSLICSMFRQLVGILPLAILLSKIGGVDYVWAAIPLAEIIAVVICSLFLAKLYKTKIKPLGAEQK